VKVCVPARRLFGQAPAQPVEPFLGSRLALVDHIALEAAGRVLGARPRLGRIAARKQDAELVAADALRLRLGRLTAA
jgi:hypothetical protein